MGDIEKSLELIKKQFLCGVSVKEIQFNDAMSTQCQRDIVNIIVHDNLVQKYPLKYVYQQAFLRRLLQKCENNNEEISDELYEAHCKFMSSNNDSPMHYRHYLMPNQWAKHIDRVIIKESRSIVSDGTTGLCCWQAAKVLAEWCLSNRNEIENKSVLELGSGVGLTGITVLNTCSPKKYTFTDCHPSVLQLLEENIRLNKSICADQEVINLAWESVDTYTKEHGPCPDLILAADVIYDSTNFNSLITAIKHLLNSADSYAIIAITVRNETTVATFMKQLGYHGLTYNEEKVPTNAIFLSSTEPSMILKIFKL